MKQRRGNYQSILSVCIVMLLFLQTFMFVATANAEHTLDDISSTENDEEQVRVVDDNYLLADAPSTPQYTFTLISSSTAYENGWIKDDDMLEGKIKWIVNIEVEDGQLDGLQFYQNLKGTGEAAVGSYVENSFMVKGNSVTPSSTGGELVYTFPANSGESATITYQTWIPKEKYYHDYSPGDSGWETIANDVELKDSTGSTLQKSNNWRIALKPDWMQMSGKLDMSVSDPFIIRWTIEVNNKYKKQGLKNFTITNDISNGLVIKSATFQKWENSNWSTSEESIMPDMNGKYSFDEVNGPIRLNIESEVTGSATSYKNTAIAKWELGDDHALNNDQGTVNEEVTVSTVPIITKQPVDSLTLNPGVTKKFSINASSAFSYQWQVNTSGAYNDFTDITDGAPYSGATTTELTITGVTESMNGYKYRVVATGLKGAKATSNSATLNVKASPTITSHPSDKTIASGSDTSFIVGATNATSYQWQIDTGSGFTNITDGAAYSGATSDTLTITGATLSMNGYQYRVVVTGNQGTTPAVSSNVTLTVNEPPTITSQPSDNTIASGSDTSFTVGATNATSYQWQVNAGSGFTNITDGAAYSGATSDTLTITGATVSLNGYQYRVVVTGNQGTTPIGSDSATLTVNSLPVYPPYIPTTQAELESLVVTVGTGKQLELSPKFQKDVISYETSTDQSEIIIETSTGESETKTTYKLNGKDVSDEVKVGLNVDENVLLIEVETKDGTIRTYTVNIYRHADEDDGDNDNEEELPVEEKQYYDTAGHWAEQDIIDATSLSIASGYDDGSFKPNKFVTRAEFLKMLMNALNPETSGTILTFSDTDHIGSWAREAIAQALQLGIVSGYGDGTFRPDAEINRSEMAVMITRALRISVNSESVHTGFADEEDIPHWAQAAIANLKQLGIVSGKDGNQFDPKGILTRAEAVKVLLNMLSELDQ